MGTRWTRRQTRRVIAGRVFRPGGYYTGNADTICAKLTRAVRYQRMGLGR